ncbi:monovalent cation/H+ antiporter complex subunit F [Georgenia alba]|uniref:Monovalent cation/H+ antiporter complex subunit F n=1 Tax=Georgenia alba TaxID=2233858 RepID=A0ABW2Q2Y9_9MICO
MSVGSVVDAVLVVCLVLLAGAVLLALFRMEKGPTMFDRAVSLDVVTIVVLGAAGLMTALADRSDLVPLLAVLAVVGFTGSVALARFAAAETPEEARILSTEELRAAAAEEVEDDAAAPVHDPDAAAEPGAETGPGPQGADGEER